MSFRESSQRRCRPFGCCRSTKTPESKYFQTLLRDHQGLRAQSFFQSSLSEQSNFCLLKWCVSQSSSRGESSGRL